MPTFLSCTAGGINRTSDHSGNWVVEHVFNSVQANDLAVSPSSSASIFAATDKGVFLSDDQGATWQLVGLKGKIVKSIAVSPHSEKVIYAGTKPARIYRSTDNGANWEELDGFRQVPGRWFWFSPAETPFKAYLHQIALSPTEPDTLLAGIEFGAVVRSTDGGAGWTGHRTRALRDCHGLRFHPTDGNYAYEAGGNGGGAAISRDGGQSWTRPKRPSGRGYAWACAADPTDPERWYVSASTSPFRAHALKGKANAVLYRFYKDKGEMLANGLPYPLPFMPYAIMPSTKSPGNLYVAMINGDLWHSANHGDSWTQLPVNAGELRRMMVLVE